MDSTKVVINTVFPVYISMTTIPPRLPNTVKIIKNFINNVSGFQKLILNLPLDYKKWEINTFFRNSLNELRSITSKHFQLNITSDIGPITKIIPSLDIIPKESILIICDDDCYHHEAFKIIAEHQDINHSKTFTFWKYPFENTDIPQGVDLISFWTPNLENLKGYWRRTLKNSHCFYVDDLVIGEYLKYYGIQVEQLSRKWKFPFIPNCLNNTSTNNSNQSLFSKDGEYSRDNSMAKCKMFIDNADIDKFPYK
jgi:hypothetical protein